MSFELLLQNLWHYAGQSVALIGVGMVLPVIFRLREPRWLLIYLQTLLMAALLLPVLQPWTRAVTVSLKLRPIASVAAHGGEVTTGGAREWQEWAVGVMAAGTGVRLLWLGLGLMRLRHYRTTATPVTLIAIEHAREATGARAEVKQSSAVAGPVTFGYLRPLVLLPPGIAALAEEAQFAVVAHELLHVKRGDWLATFLEELVTAALWWHPAIWLLTARIRLVREQLIDRAVVRLTDSPRPYVEALLTFADGQPQMRLAPQFLRRRHLAVRIKNLLSEVSMSRTRLIATYTVITAVATATAYISMGAFPLRAAPQFNNAGVSGAEVVLRKAPIYPSVAKRKGVEGSVVVEATIAENGSVSDARVLSGPQELRSAALEAVLQWQFKNGTTAQVTVNFSLTKDGGAMPAARLTGIETGSLPAEMAETLRARLAHLQGEPVNAAEINAIVQGVSPNLRISLRSDAANASVLTIASTAAVFAKGETPQIRVGGNVQAAKMVNKVAPAYPPEAKRERIQGTVRFAALIGMDGRVKQLYVEGGHPLLVESATKAVQQWEYQPTLLNGNPVEVLTSIDVNYTLLP